MGYDIPADHHQGLPSHAVEDNSTVISPEQDQKFVNLMESMARKIYQRNAEKGFWDEGTNRNKGELIALLHSEISEMLEAVRKVDQPFMSTKIPDFTGEEEELADLFIRAFDYAAGFKLRIGEAIMMKLAYNKSRPHKHGKKY